METTHSRRPETSKPEEYLRGYCTASTKETDSILSDTTFVIVFRFRALILSSTKKTSYLDTLAFVSPPVPVAQSSILDSSPEVLVSSRKVSAIRTYIPRVSAEQVTIIYSRKFDFFMRRQRRLMPRARRIILYIFRSCLSSAGYPSEIIGACL